MAPIEKQVAQLSGLPGISKGPATGIDLKVYAIVSTLWIYSPDCIIA